MSTHLSLALADFPNFDGISDKELYFVLEKYKCELELDMTHVDSSETYKDSDFSIEDILEEEDY